MKKQKLWIVAACACWLAGINTHAGETAAAAVAYDIKISEFEGCECNSVCPCIFRSDATYGDCRAVLAFTFTGTYGDTPLDGVPGVVAVTRSGHNMEANMGTWTGALYTSEKSSQAETAAVHAILNAMLGGAFAQLDMRKAPIQISQNGDTHELVMGDIAHLKVTTMRRADGGVTVVENPPSPIAFPRMVCAVSDIHHYNDGTASWSFPGRNAFSSEIVMKSGG